MRKRHSQFFAITACGALVMSGVLLQSAGAMQKMDNKVSNTHLTSQSSASSAAEVKDNPSAKFGAQWSDQLIRERDEAKKGKEQAQKERDQAQQERDEAVQASESAKSQGSIQAKSGSGQGNSENDQIAQERDQYLKDRDDLNKETAQLRQERDKAMQSIAGGSPLDAVDRSMPVKQRH